MTGVTVLEIVVGGKICKKDQALRFQSRVRSARTQINRYSRTENLILLEQHKHTEQGIAGL